MFVVIQGFTRETPGGLPSELSEKAQRTAQGDAHYTGVLKVQKHQKKIEGEKGRRRDPIPAGKRRKTISGAKVTGENQTKDMTRLKRFLGSNATKHRKRIGGKKRTKRAMPKHAVFKNKTERGKKEGEKEGLYYERVNAGKGREIEIT